MGPNYFKHPIFILYWIALKKNMKLEDWADMMLAASKDQQDPIEKAIIFIKQYKK